MKRNTTATNAPTPAIVTRKARYASSSDEYSFAMLAFSAPASPISPIALLPGGRLTYCVSRKVMM